MKWFKFILGLFFVALFMPAMMSSCVKDDVFLTDASAKLEFSSDTISFDTVFTTMGTVTQVLMVYNPYDDPLKISSISLCGSYASRFRLNVDGDTAMVIRDKLLAAHDSLFVFVRACINPNSQLEPFLVEDAVAFELNGKEQKVVLQAFGRNAVYHLPDHVIYDAQGNPYSYSIIDCDNWDHSRPHVIMGYGVVDEGNVLRLHPGETVYMGSDSYLWIYEGGTLDAQGSQGNPITFTSMRHDGYYDSLPGQWGYLWLSAGSVDNVLDWCQVENATVGLLIDTNVNGRPTLKISNSIIENHSYAGIIAQGAIVEGDNLLVDNCGIATLALQYGGDYLFANSTFANYWSYDIRTMPSLILNNHYDYIDPNTEMVRVYPRPLRRAEFRNCIIYGNYEGSDHEGEISFQQDPGALFNVSFDHCLVRSGVIDSADNPAAALLVNRDPLFLSPKGHDYHLLPESPAIAAGYGGHVFIHQDLDGQSRMDPPSIGAYEYRDTSELKITHKLILSPCTATSQADWQRSLRRMRSLTARGSAICLKSPSIHIHR